MGIRHRRVVFLFFVIRRDIQAHPVTVFVIQDFLVWLIIKIHHSWDAIYVIPEHGRHQTRNYVLPVLRDFHPRGMEIHPRQVVILYLVIQRGIQEYLVTVFVPPDFLAM